MDIKKIGKFINTLNEKERDRISFYLYNLPINDFLIWGFISELFALHNIFLYNFLSGTFFMLLGFLLLLLSKVIRNKFYKKVFNKYFNFERRVK